MNPTRFLPIILALFAFVGAMSAQTSAPAESSQPTSSAASEDASNVHASKEEHEAANSKQKYRLLQSNDFLVDSPYLQEENELEHAFSVTLTGGKWTTRYTLEAPINSDRHQFSVSLPTQFARNGSDYHSGFGDVEFAYNYALVGSNSSRLAVSPGFGLRLPTGDAHKELGIGGTAVSAKLPIGFMITPRFGSNSIVEASYVRSARNEHGEKANIAEYEFGQSLIWYAKPRLNFLVEGVWEMSQEVTGPGMKEYEHEAFISPGVRWAHSFKNGVIMTPGIAFPIGVGPSSGHNGIFFYIAFEHSIKKHED